MSRHTNIKTGDKSRGGRQSWKRLLLAHHRLDQLHHCYRLKTKQGGFHVCARCLGLYPALLGVMALVLSSVWHPGPHCAYRWMGILGALGVVDWGLVRLGLWEGHNVLRTLSGAAMGVGMGMAFPYYFMDPYDANFWTVGIALTVGASAVEIVARYLDDT